jgi:hypothetical protein
MQRHPSNGLLLGHPPKTNSCHHQQSGGEAKLMIADCSTGRSETTRVQAAKKIGRGVFDMRIGANQEER